MPSSRPELRRFINEIVLGEECDEYNVAGMRRFISHFELYLLSMEEVKADTRPIRQFISVVNEYGFGSSHCSTASNRICPINVSIHSRTERPLHGISLCLRP